MSSNISNLWENKWLKLQTILTISEFSIILQQQT